MKNIGILGSGAVAQALGNGFLKEGHRVMLGTRDPAKLDAWLDNAGPEASIGSFAEAAAFGDLVVIAAKGTAAAEVLKQAGSENLAGKTIIDTTNPIADAPPQDGVLQFFTGPNSSLMEQLQDALPEANFVKAFNSVGNSAMYKPDFSGGRPTMFICGNNDDARGQVTSVLNSFGWEVSDMGRAAAARAIEPLCQLWCIPGFLRNEWSHAFKLVK